jgi:hypothetical protein
LVTSPYSTPLDFSLSLTRYVGTRAKLSFVPSQIPSQISLITIILSQPTRNTMIDLQQLLDSVDDSLDDSSRSEATLRLLCSTIRRYNQTCEELERLKTLTGFDKPFPILRLPREIRDKIYTYSLRARKLGRNDASEALPLDRSRILVQAPSIRHPAHK